MTTVFHCDLLHLPRVCYNQALIALSNKTFKRDGVLDYFQEFLRKKREKNKFKIPPYWLSFNLKHIQEVSTFGNGIWTKLFYLHYLVFRIVESQIVIEN